MAKNKAARLEKTKFLKFIDELVLAYNEDKIEDFTAIYSEREGFNGEINHCWLSGENGSATHCMGLAEYMKQQIYECLQSSQ